MCIVMMTSKNRIYNEDETAYERALRISRPYSETLKLLIKELDDEKCFLSLIQILRDLKDEVLEDKHKKLI